MCLQCWSYLFLFFIIILNHHLLHSICLVYSWSTLILHIAAVCFFFCFPLPLIPPTPPPSLSYILGALPLTPLISRPPCTRNRVAGSNPTPPCPEWEILTGILHQERYANLCMQAQPWGGRWAKGGEAEWPMAHGSMALMTCQGFLCLGRPAG